MNVTAWPDRVIRWGFYLLFGLVPLLLTPWNYELFEFNKMMAVYALTVIIGGAWLFKSIQQGEFRVSRTPLDIPILLFLSSQLLSSLFSIDPHVSWFGYYSRFNGGMLSIFSYILLYYAFVSNCANETVNQRDSGSKNNKNLSDTLTPFLSLTRFLKVSLATGVVVALYGVAERLGVDRHLWVQDVQSRVFSTLGQPNWLAAYLVALIPIAMAFALQVKSQSFGNAQDDPERSRMGQKSKVKSYVWLGVSALFFTVLLFTRSRSGLFGFVVADMVFWGFTFIALRWRKGDHDTLLKRLGLPFFLLHFAFFLIVFFNGTYIDSVDRWLTLEGWKTRITNRVSESVNQRVSEATPSAQYTAPLLETGGTESGTIRKYVWQGALSAWRSSTKAYLIGTGTETFAFAFYQYRPKEHNLTSEWDFLYNKAHNEYLNYLATTGIFGLGSYLLLIGTFIWWFLKSQWVNGSMIHRKTADPFDPIDSLTLRIALFAGWLSILVTNFFGFSVVIVQVFLFLFPALVFSLDSVSSHNAIQQSVLSLRIPRWSSWVVVLLLVVLVVFVGTTWYADTLYASGYRASRAGAYDVAAQKLTQALRFNPGEPLFADELGSAYAGLVTAAIDEKDASGAAVLVKRSLAASDQAITTSPANANFWKTRTKIYYTFSAFDPAFNDAAIEALGQSQKLSPNDPKITYNLSILYGRKGDNTKAIDLLKTTIDLKPNYRDAYYALYVFYTEVKKTDLARIVLKEYLSKVDAKDKDFLEKYSQ